MKKFILCLVFLMCPLGGSATTLEANVSKLGRDGSNVLIDSTTQVPISGADVKIPKTHYSTKTDSNGRFYLKTKINGQTILSVEKDGYKPYSLTIDESSLSKPMVIGIEKAKIGDIKIETSMIHLGDNSYSDTSANAGEFSIKASGASYSKSFMIKSIAKNNYLVIGSIIGIDTLMAKSMGQNRIVSTYSTPVEVFLNGMKISEIRVNGDNQRILLPKQVIKSNANNIITIKTGRNVMQTAYIDYDDIEFMNLSLEFE